MFDNHEQLFKALLAEETLEVINEPGKRVRLVDGWLVGINGLRWDGIGNPNRYRLVPTKPEDGKVKEL